MPPRRPLPVDPAIVARQLTARDRIAAAAALGRRIMAQSDAYLSGPWAAAYPEATAAVKELRTLTARVLVALDAD